MFPLQRTGTYLVDDRSGEFDCYANNNLDTRDLTMVGPYRKYM
jgi:hypothetical protein